MLDEFRRKNYMTETAVEDIRISTTVEDVENSYILDESSLNNVRKVQILMDELTPRQRQVFTLYYIEQRKYDVILCSLAIGVCIWIFDFVMVTAVQMILSLFA